MNWYGYCGNNPCVYIDLDGRVIRGSDSTYNQSSPSVANVILGGSESTTTIGVSGCTLTMYSRIASVLAGISISPAAANDYANENGLFSGDDGNELTIAAGIDLINGLLEENGILGVSVSLETTLTGNPGEIDSKLKAYDDSPTEYFANARISTENADKTQTYNHSLNNTLIRIDILKVNRTLVTGEE